MARGKNPVVWFVLEAYYIEGFNYICREPSLVRAELVDLLIYRKGELKDVFTYIDNYESGLKIEQKAQKYEERGYTVKFRHKRGKNYSKT